MNSRAIFFQTRPNYLFVPQNQRLQPEYEEGWKVNELFPINSVALYTARDNLTIHWSKKEVEVTIKDFVSLTEEEARQEYQLDADSQEWKVAFAQKDIQDTKLDSALIVPILYRPFDIRYTYYTGHSRGFICRPRTEVMRHMLKENLALITTRQITSLLFNNIYCANSVIEYKTGSHDRNSSVFPLYVYPNEGEMQFDAVHRSPNLNPDFIKVFSEKLGLKFIEDGKGVLQGTFGPEDIFNYAYAVFHSPTYRHRYAEFLKIDFPRLPLTSNQVLFKTLAEKGAELVALHLMESQVLNMPITKYPVAGSNLVEKVEHKEAEKRIFINKEQYFGGVPLDVWNFHIGGYQVCEKWLKDRKGRTLSYDDVTRYQKIIVALKETLRLMTEIDAVIPDWPIE